MKKAIVLMLGLISLCFAQENQNSKKGMFWYYFEKAKNCSGDLTVTIKTRNEAFKNLDAKVAEGDPNKIRLYMTRAREAQVAVARNHTCDTTGSKLEESAGEALNSKTDSWSTSGVATEPEYDEAMALVKNLREKLKSQGHSNEQKAIWAAAVKKANLDPVIYKLDQ